MSSQHTAIGNEASEMPCQAQLKREEILNKESHSHGQSMNSQSSDDQNSSIASQATNFLQQTGEQVKHMAQEAADAVKNTLGMNKADNSSNSPTTTDATTTIAATSTNHPSNPFPRT